MNDVEYIRKHDPFFDIVEEHVSEASWLWECRVGAVKQANQQVASLLKLESRIDKHIAGLLLDADSGWAFTWEALQEFNGAGESFVAAILAFLSGERFRIRRVVEVSREDANTFKGLVSAIGWLPKATVEPWIKRLLLSGDMADKYLAISACSVQRFHPGNELKNILSNPVFRNHPKLYARALRLVGELKCLDLTDQVSDIAQQSLNHHGSEDDSIGFWANWSAALLGNEPTDDCVAQYLLDSDYQQLSLENLFRCLSNQRSREWIEVLVEDSALSRQAVDACAALGDPKVIDWLIEKMHDIKLARLAGAAFSMITGTDLDKEGLRLTEAPKKKESEAVDGDNFLEWPDPDKIITYWRDNCKNYQSGQRYLLGKEIQLPHLQSVLPQAYQKQRRAIAFELARCSGTDHYLNMSAKILGVS